MTTSHNGYVPNPLTPEKLREIVEMLSNMADAMEAGKLIHIGGTLSISRKATTETLFSSRTSITRMGRNMEIISDLELMEVK